MCHEKFGRICSVMEKVDILAIVPARAGLKNSQKNLGLLGNETLVSSNNPAESGLTSCV